MCWRSSTRRVPPAPPRGWCTLTRRCSNIRRILNEIRGLTANDKLFCNSPFFWVGGIAFAVLATLLAGSTLVCSNATDAGDTLDLLEAEKPTMTNGFVAGIAHLARHPSLPRAI